MAVMVSFSCASVIGRKLTSVPSSCDCSCQDASPQCSSSRASAEFARRITRADLVDLFPHLNRPEGGYKQNLEAPAAGSLCMKERRRKTPTSYEEVDIQRDGDISDLGSK